MGQKTHPYGFRLGFNKSWKSLWYADGPEYIDRLHEDLKVRKFIKKSYYHAAIQDIIIERITDSINVKIFAARPGVIIGKGGKELQNLKAAIKNLIGKDISIEIKEYKKPELSAQLTAEQVAFRLEKRTAFRRAMRSAVSAAIKVGAEGIKIMVSGRLGGAEIARSEWYLVGKVPLQTLKADIDYGFAEAFTTYGQIGIKVWIYKGTKEKEKSKKNILREEA